MHISNLFTKKYIRYLLSKELEYSNSKKLIGLMHKIKYFTTYLIIYDIWDICIKIKHKIYIKLIY